METNINIPKTKAVNVLFQSIKFHTYIFIFVNISQNIASSQSPYCTEQGQELQKIMGQGSVCLIIFSTIGLFYIWCREQFARVEFWLIYSLNFVWFIGIVIDLLKTVHEEPKECIEIIMTQKTFLILSVKNQIELLMALMLPTEYAAKFVNMASNLLFPYLLVSSGSHLSTCHQSGGTIIFSICFVHGFINILATLMNSVLMCMGRKGRKLQSFRFFIMIALVGFLIVYVIVFLSEDSVVQEPRCVPLQYVLQSYVYISPIAIASMMLILLAVKSDQGDDVRSKAIQQQQKNANDNDYIIGVTSKLGGAYGVLSQANHTDKSKVIQLKQGFGTLKN